MGRWGRGPEKLNWGGGVDLSENFSLVPSVHI